MNPINIIRENPRFRTFFTVNRPFFFNFYSTTRKDCAHSQSYTYNPIGGVGWRFFPLNSFRLFHCCFSVRVPYKTSLHIPLSCHGMPHTTGATFHANPKEDIFSNGLQFFSEWTTFRHSTAIQLENPSYNFLHNASLNLLHNVPFASDNTFRVATYYKPPEF